LESSHDNSAGTFPLEKFGIQNFRDSSIVLLQPSTIAFTNNPQTPGEFSEGSISAKFTDQQVTGSAYTMSTALLGYEGNNKDIDHYFEIINLNCG
jgi:hypothetical protein